MESIKIEGLRSLENTGEVPIKQLNIALGRNSCGKSTFLRFFALLKQSMETKTSEPLLWYGKYVDFGSFKQAKTSWIDTNTISFEFKINTNKLFIPSWNRVRKVIGRELIMRMEIVNNELKRIFMKNNDSTAFTHNIDVRFGKESIIEALMIDGHSFGDEYTKSLKYTNHLSGFIPRIVYSKDAYCEDSSVYVNYEKTNPELANFVNEYFDSIDSNNKEIYCFKWFLQSNLFNTYKKVHALEKEKSFKVEGILSSVEYATFKSNLKKNTIINELSCSFMDIYQAKYLDKKNTKDDLDSELAEYIEKYSEKAHRVYLYNKIGDLIEGIQVYMNGLCQNMTYIGPFRSIAERFYRVQGLDIDEVDSKGDNVPMILKSMKSNEKKEFNAWLYSQFNFELTVETLNEHSSIFINNGSQKVNLADSGFGYSQIIPILLALWKNKGKKIGSRRIPLFIIIEQPELHLHPMMQKQLIKAIINIIKLDKSKSLRFIIETHSESIIQYIGEEIEKKTIDSNKVNVILFEQEQSMTKTSLTSVQFTDDGYLTDWPIGFFDGDDRNDYTH